MGLQCRELGRLSSKKPRLINHGSACGIDLKTFDKRNYLNSPFREIYGLDENDFLVVFIGRPEIRKGFRVVLDLFLDPRIISEKKIKLLLCGPSKDDVMKLFSSIPENIIPLGYCDNVPEVLSNSQCLILPSYHEGLPYVCIEAQLMECLVVANKIPGILDIVKADETGYLIEGNEQQKYVETILEISRVGCVTERLVLEAKRKVMKYNREEFMRHYINYLSDYEAE